jgi:hypothetical protein
MSRLSNFIKLPAEEKILSIEAFFFIVAVRLALWLIPFRLFQKFAVENLSGRARQDETDWAKIKKIARLVGRVNGLLPFTTCLTQALAALLMIKLSGQESELKIGVAKSGGRKFEAHAWLEKNGRIILGRVPEHERYVTLNFYPK